MSDARPGHARAMIATARKLGLARPGYPAPSATRFGLADVTVVQPGVRRLEHVDLTVAAGVIAAITPAAGIDRTAPSSGGYVLPGLADMHTHLPPDNILGLTGYALLLFLAHGITSIRDAGDLDAIAIPAARAHLAGGGPGPRVFSAGAFVTAGRPRWPNSLVLTTAADAEPAVARLAAQGHTFVKSYENLTLEMITAVKTAADRHGLGVMGHVRTRLRYEEALLPDPQHFFGVPLPEHLGRDSVLCRGADWDRVDDARLQQIVDVTLEHGLANTPTLAQTAGLLRYGDYPATRTAADVALLPAFHADVVWHPRHGLPVYRGLDGPTLARLRDALATKQRLVAMLAERGAPLHLGTDTGQPFVVPGTALHTELALFTQAGVPAEQAWRYATEGAGRTLSRHGGPPALGQIQVGAPADLLVVDADPTRTPTDATRLLTGLRTVVAAGARYDRNTLTEAIAQHRAYHRTLLYARLSRRGARRAMARTAATFDA
jgi:imidazolonepropionase-like amidohydrolase